MTELWRPAASLSALQQRALLLAAIRQFFAERNVLEVETPLLAPHAVTDPHMPVITAQNPRGQGDDYYLQTSPEYAMKRLLAAGSGAIYQLCKAFRAGEAGSRHNPEFTMLEWYRPDFDEHQLMDEVECLVSRLLMPGEKKGEAEPFKRISYGQLFRQILRIDPHSASADELEQLARARLDIQMQSGDRDDWLHLLMAELIEPGLGSACPVFIYDYPASQSALARVELNRDGVPVARRFELYIDGFELANGYFELTDAEEQAKRFERERELRRLMGKEDRAPDGFLLAAMREQGLPSCAGVAMGVDRLLMVQRGIRNIRDVLAFPVD